MARASEVRGCKTAARRRVTVTGFQQVGYRIRTEILYHEDPGLIMVVACTVITAVSENHERAYLFARPFLFLRSLQVFRRCQKFDEILM
jgi:hypothetical protein